MRSMRSHNRFTSFVFLAILLILMVHPIFVFAAQDVPAPTPAPVITPVTPTSPAMVLAAIGVLGLLIQYLLSRIVEPFVPAIVNVLARVGITTTDTILQNFAGLVIGVIAAFAFQFNLFATWNPFPLASMFTLIFATGLIVGSGGDGVAAFLKLGGLGVQYVAAKVQSVQAEAAEPHATLQEVVGDPLYARRIAQSLVNYPLAEGDSPLDAFVTVGMLDKSLSKFSDTIDRLNAILDRATPEQQSPQPPPEMVPASG